ncbi:trypsin-1-like protein, partial [Dinothrombium tinctorium]
ISTVFICLCPQTAAKSRSNVACGIRYSVVARNARVVGGTPAVAGNHPWHAYILKNRKQHCGGTVIDTEWVLTAAHCIFGVNEPLVVLVGSYHYSNAYNKGRFHHIRQAVLHPDFNPLIAFHSDIALLRVKPPIQYTSGDRTGRGAVIPVCLPAQNQEFPNTYARVSGYGLTREKGVPSRMLKTVQVTILNKSACRVYTGVRKFREDRMICAGNPSGGRDACQGDSGGPLNIMYNDRVYQIGIVSFGEGCGRSRYPGVYTKVAHFRNWIDRKLR